jgi:predicted small metal-binding protein
MGKQVNCSDLGQDCDFSAWAETEEELLELVGVHAKQAHGIDEVTPELLAQLRQAIKEA